MTSSGVSIICSRVLYSSAVIRLLQAQYVKFDVMYSSTSLYTKNQDKPKDLVLLLPSHTVMSLRVLASLVANDPIQPLEPQLCKKPVISLALPDFVVMSSTSPMTLGICCILWAGVIDDSENRLDLVRTGLLELAWSN